MYIHSEKGTKRYKNCDYVHSNIGENYSILAMADGMQTGEIARRGVKKITDDVVKCVANNIEEYLNMPEEWIKHQIACCMMFSMQELKRIYNVDRETFASTFMLVCMCRKKKLVVHIGDGVIGGVRSAGLALVSEPENGIGKEFTFMTTASSMSNRLRVSLVDSKDMHTIFMVTDGCSSQIYERGVKRFKEWFVEKMSMGEYNEIIDIIRTFKLEDDWSFLCLQV